MAQYPRMDPYSRSRYEQGIDAKIVIMGNTGTCTFQQPFTPASFSYLRAIPFTGVGKTSLLHRYTQNKFDPKNTTSTTGAFFVTKKVYVDGLKVRLQLWDTAGQERFRSMVSCLLHCLFNTLHNALATHNLLQAPMYYRGANAALLLYDITNASTFDDIRGWLEGEHPFSTTLLSVLTF